MSVNDPSPDDSYQDLLVAIRVATANRIQPGAFAVPLGALLIKLSRDAERTATKVVRLTWALVGLTVALLVLTAYLAWHEASQQGDQNPDLNAQGHAQQAQPKPAPMPK